MSKAIKKLSNLLFEAKIEKYSKKVSKVSIRALFGAKGEDNFRSCARPTFAHNFEREARTSPRCLQDASYTAPGPIWEDF